MKHDQVKICLKDVVATGLVCAAIAASGQGVRGDDASHRDLVAVREKLEASIPHLTVVSIAKSPVAELFEVEVEERNAIFYVVTDGTHLVAGDMYALGGTGLVNVSEVRRGERRREILETVDLDELIVFAANGKPNAVVHVFTDVECEYCRRLHAEIAELNARGIEVRYLAHPNAGMESVAATRMAAAWCATNPGLALTALMEGRSIPVSTCDDPVAEHLALGERMHVQATPTMITADGDRIERYLPPEELARRLVVGLRRE